MGGQKAWDDFYKKRPRPWRGFRDVPVMDLPSNSKVLDAGCGNGKTSLRLIELGFDVTGIDFSPRAIDYCLKNHGDKAEFITGNCLEMPFADNLFDGIYAVHLTEHIDDERVKIFSSECFRILKPDGKLFVRSFSPKDMRSGKSARNGIVYTYRNHKDIADLFSEFVVIESYSVDEVTRFDKLRSRSECIFSKPP